MPFVVFLPQCGSLSPLSVTKSYPYMIACFAQLLVYINLWNGYLLCVVFCQCKECLVFCGFQWKKASVTYKVKKLTGIATLKGIICREVDHFRVKKLKRCTQS